MPRRLAAALGLSAVLPLAALLLMQTLHVPMGAGQFAYHFSTMSPERLSDRTWPAVIAGALAAAGVWCMSGSRRRPVVGSALTVAGVVGLVAWTWWSPPGGVVQHLMNLSSPSQDGAFVQDARPFKGVRDYLGRFESRIAVSPQQFGTTRIMSNPPGMTLIVYAVRATRGHAPWLERWVIGDDAASLPTDLSPALRVGLLLLAAWGASAWFAYLAGRLLLSPAGAATFAIVATFNPCTVNFVPGKDPAQLLTINAMIWAWLAACLVPAADSRRGFGMGAVAGLALGAGLVVGLIHVWVAAAVFCATAWAGGVRSVLRPAIGAAVGAALWFLILRLTLGWNAPHTLWLVYRRFKDIQPVICPNPRVWFMIGLPIFLLFTSPGWVAPLWIALRRRSAHVSEPSGRHPLGRPLLIATLATMAATYVVGVSYELPRLWVAFIPPLTLGAMAACPLFRGSWNASRHARWALAAVVGAQVAFTVVHLTLMDARESEMRLLSHQLFW